MTKIPLNIKHYNISINKLNNYRCALFFDKIIARSALLMMDI